jgi:hypothetical protein
MLNNTPIRWISKCQKTVETSTYSSELLDSRIATEFVLEVRYMLRLLRVALDGPTLMSIVGCGWGVFAASALLGLKFLEDSK